MASCKPDETEDKARDTALCNGMARERTGQRTEEHVSAADALPGRQKLRCHVGVGGDNVKDILDGVVKAAELANPQLPEDYVDEKTGLLMCGKCHTAKQTKVTLFGEERIVPSSCRCAMAEYEARRAAELEQERLIQIQSRRNRCFGHAGRKAEYTFEADDGADPQTMRIARGYVAEFPSLRRRGKGLLLLGPTGTGKTFAACCIANALVERGYSVQVTTFAEVAMRLQSNWDKEDVYEDICSCDLLVLDDLGAERETSYMSEIVYTVIDARCNAKLPTIVTTNIDADEFVSGGVVTKNRVFSRLYEMCVPVSVTGADRRRAQMIRDTAADMSALLSAGNKFNGKGQAPNGTGKNER